MKIAFLLGQPEISGGTYVIFEHSQCLCAMGHDVLIVTEEPVKPRRYAWHPDAHRLRWVTFDDIRNEAVDLAFCTWWRTLYDLERIEALQYAYFIQSIETRFFPQERFSIPDQIACRRLCDATYLVQMPVVTIASWMRRYLEENYGSKPFLVRNGIRKELYTPFGAAHAPRDSQRLRFLVEGAVDVSFKNVTRTISLCREAGADEIWLLTPTPTNNVSDVDRVFSQLPIWETPPVYRSCDVLVKLSYVEGMFGPPLEMFHCGGTVVTYDVTGYEEYIVNGKNGVVVQRDDESQILSVLRDLRSNHDYLDSLKQGAMQTAASWPDWRTSSCTFEKACYSIMEQPKISRGLLERTSEHFFAWYSRDRFYCELNANPGIDRFVRFLSNRPYVRWWVEKIFNVCRRANNFRRDLFGVR